jgi:two-component system nitrogen regulation response regulator NtrX
MVSDILIVDDEADIRELVAGILQDEGHGTRMACDSDEALAAVVARRPNLVFLDIWLKVSRLDGLQLLDSLKQQHSELPIVMISVMATSKPRYPRSNAAPMISSKSRSRPIACCSWPNARFENSRLKREVWL